MFLFNQGSNSLLLPSASTESVLVGMLRSCGFSQEQHATLVVVAAQQRSSRQTSNKRSTGELVEVGGTTLEIGASAFSHDIAMLSDTASAASEGMTLINTFEQDCKTRPV